MIPADEVPIPIFRSIEILRQADVSLIDTGHIHKRLAQGVLRRFAILMMIPMEFIRSIL
jgi:hypothetical protein